MCCWTVLYPPITRDSNNQTCCREVWGFMQCYSLWATTAVSVPAAPKKCVCDFVCRPQLSGGRSQVFTHLWTAVFLWQCLEQLFKSLKSHLSAVKGSESSVAADSHCKGGTEAPPKCLYTLLHKCIYTATEPLNHSVMLGSEQAYFMQHRVLISLNLAVYRCLCL